MLITLVSFADPAVADSDIGAAAAHELLSAGISNDPNVQALPGYLYDEGLGVKKDRAEAAHWYRSAAELGNPIAQVNIEIMYGEGEGVGRGLVEAYRWFDRAADTFPPGADHDDAIGRREFARALMTPEQRREVGAESAQHPPTPPQEH